MAEKPRLKETDEIFTSIGKGTAAKTPPLPVASQTAADEPATGAQEEMITSLLDEAERPATRSGRRTSRRSSRRAENRSEASADRQTDSNPLDFGKYSLPSRDGGEKEEPEPTPEASNPGDQPDIRPDAKENPEPAPRKASASGRQSNSRRTNRRTSADIPPEQLIDAVMPQGSRRRTSAEIPPEPLVESVLPQGSRRRTSAEIPPEPLVESVPPRHAALNPDAEGAAEKPGEPVVTPYLFEDLEANTDRDRQEQDSGERSRKSSRGNQAPSGRARSRARDLDSDVMDNPDEEPLAQGSVELDGDSRADFLRELSSKFDEAFAERFESGIVAEDAATQSANNPAEETGHSRTRRRSGASQRLESLSKASEPDDSAREKRTPKTSPRSAASRTSSKRSAAEPRSSFDVLESGRETDEFIERFEQQVQKEESARIQQFKDTLAEKFERERERYLKELGIEEQREEEDTPEPPPAIPSPPAVRRLDVQINPEMHVQEPLKERERNRDFAARQQPVTYSRAGVLRLLTGEDDGVPEEESAPEDSNLNIYTRSPRRRDVEGSAVRREDEDERTPPGPAPGAKKTSEQLLLEFAAQNLLRPPAKAPENPAVQLPEKLTFKAVTDSSAKQSATDKREPAKKQKKTSSISTTVKRTIGISAVVFVGVLAFVAWSLSSLWNSNLEPGGGSSDPAGTVVSGDTLTAYETREFTQRASYKNVQVRRSGVLLKNISVSDYLVIEEIETPGEVRLENITVDGALYINNCAVNAVHLQDVSAQRVVISNPRERVALTITGMGEIGTLEVKTPAWVTRMPQLGADSGGVRDMILNASTDISVLNVSMAGIELRSLTSYGETVLDLDAESSVEQMMSEGSVSVSGKGEILRMTAEPAPGTEEAIISLGLPVSNLTIQGNSRVVVGGLVSTMTTSGALTLSGSGKVASLILDVPLSGGRLPVDIVDIGVDTLISNTQARVNVTGTGRVAELSANESVYALGNKINHIKVNADGVIYEREPDKITTASGIRPPGSVADNPNLDYNMSAAPDTQVSEMAEPHGDDGIATTCGHARENGGFIAGDGSRLNPYQVTTPAQLAHISAHLESHFSQENDIDIAEDTRYLTGFPMIGSDTDPFSGSYEGWGFSISNLRISSSASNVGLFAQSIGTIQHVNIASGEIRATSDLRSYVGAICGFSYQDGLVSSCSNGAKVYGTPTAYVGGIVGYNHSGAKIRDCFNMAMITGSANVGGIVGVNRDGAGVSGCYNAGTVTGEGLDTGAVAGVNADGIIANCYFLADTAISGIGTGEGTAMQKSTDEFSTNQMVADLSAGNDTSLWTKGEGNYTYPILKKPVRPTS